MSEELRVEFKVAISRRPEPKPKPEPGVKTERLRVDGAARRARNLALAYWIDGLIRSGEIEDLAAVAHLCGVSRARISKLISLLGVPAAEQERLLGVYVGRRHVPPDQHATHQMQPLVADFARTLP